MCVCVCMCVVVLTEEVERPLVTEKGRFLSGRMRLSQMGGYCVVKQRSTLASSLSFPFFFFCVCGYRLVLILPYSLRFVSRHSFLFCVCWFTVLVTELTSDDNEKKTEKGERKATASAHNKKERAALVPRFPS